MTDGTDYEKLKWTLSKQLRRSSISASSGSLAVQNIWGTDELRGDSYCTKVSLAAAIGLCHTLLSAVVITIVFFSAQTNDRHAAMFAIALVVMRKSVANSVDNAANSEERVIALRNRSRTSVSFAHAITTRMIEDTGEGYFVSVKWAILRGISQVLMGMTVMSTCIYSIHNAKLHAASFSIAYHLFVVEAILSLSYINGWSTPMRRKHRRLTHAFLQFCALCCVGYGVFIITTLENIPSWRNIHGVSGLVTLLLTGMNWAISPFVIRHIHGAAAVHMLCGVLCFLMSSMCLGSGIATPPFTNWAGLSIVPMLFAFIAFYTIFIVFTSYKKWSQRT